MLPEVTIAYETWGSLDDERGNAVLITHALTGDSHAAGEMGPGHPSDGWWKDLIGPDKAIDTNEYFVVCANVLGGCQGTTGPSSIDPETGKPYGPTFPQVTIRDIVRTQHMLMNHLDLPHWLSVVGGSMGGMQVLEWGAMYPDLVKSLIPVASVAAASPQQIGWSAVDGWRSSRIRNGVMAGTTTPNPATVPGMAWHWPGRSPRSPTARPRSSMTDSVANR